MKALYRVMDVEGGNPQLAPASSQVKETAFSQDEVMYSHPFDGGPIPPANRRRAASLAAYSRPMLVDSSSSEDESLPPLVTDSSSSEDESLPPLVTDSSSESLPPLVESSSSGSATIMLDDSSSSDDSATLGELR